MVYTFLKAPASDHASGVCCRCLLFPLPLLALAKKAGQGRQTGERNFAKGCNCFR